MSPPALPGDLFVGIDVADGVGSAVLLTVTPDGVLVVTDHITWSWENLRWISTEAMGPTTRERWERFKARVTR